MTDEVEKGYIVTVIGMDEDYKLGNKVTTHFAGSFPIAKKISDEYCEAISKAVGIPYYMSVFSFGDVNGRREDMAWAGRGAQDVRRLPVVTITEGYGIPIRRIVGYVVRVSRKGMDDENIFCETKEEARRLKDATVSEGVLVEISPLHEND